MTGDLTPAPPARRPRWHWRHRWTVWGKPYVPEWGALQRQQRTCLRCGVVNARTVGLDD